MVSDPLQFEKSSQNLIQIVEASKKIKSNMDENKKKIYFWYKFDESSSIVATIYILLDFWNYILPDHADTMFEPGFCKFYKTRVHTWYRRDPVQYNFKNRVKFI